MIHYAEHYLDEEDIEAVVAQLRTGSLTQGKTGQKFAQALADTTEFNHCTLTNSATSALHIACLALGVGSGDRVWVAANSFVASANCARYCGAEVDFVDIELTTGAIAIDHLDKKLEACRRANQPLPKALVVVHYAGHFCDMPAIRQLADRFQVKVIEDASHALGAQPPSAWTSGERGDIAVYSFHAIKMITTGEGGAAVTNDESLATLLAKFGNHGIERDASKFERLEPEPWVYEQQLLGYNYRMSDIQAALGLSQLGKLAQFVDRRQALASRYLQRLPKSVQPIEQRHGRSSYHLFPVVFATEQAASQAYYTLKQNGIICQKNYIPIDQQPFYFRQDRVCTTALDFYRKMLSLPMHLNLTNRDVDRVCEVLHDLPH